MYEAQLCEFCTQTPVPGGESTLCQSFLYTISWGDGVEQQHPPLSLLPKNPTSKLYFIEDHQLKSNFDEDIAYGQLFGTVRKNSVEFADIADIACLSYHQFTYQPVSRIIILDARHQ